MDNTGLAENVQVNTPESENNTPESENNISESENKMPDIAETGVLFSNERLEDLSKLLKKSQIEYRVRKINHKWGCLIIPGASIEDCALRDKVLQLSNHVPFIYYSLDTHGWEYRVFNRGEECATFHINFQPMSTEEEIRTQLMQRNQVLFKLFELRSSDIDELERVFRYENFTNSEVLWKCIGTFSKIMQLPDRGWVNGVLPATGEKDNQRYAGYSMGDFKVGKAEKDSLGYPGFFKLWFLIWIKPRQVIRYIVDGSFIGDSIPLIFVICMITPIMQALMGGRKETIAILLLASIPGGLIALGVVLLNAIFFKWTGQLLDGKGDYAELRAVVAWACPVKLMTTVGLYFLSMLFFKKSMVVSISTLIFFFNFHSGVKAIFFVIIAAIVELWYFWVHLSCLKEVQRFSYGKAIVNFLLTTGIYFVILLMFNMLRRGI